MGATSGIGLHVAESLAAAGWRVGVAGRRDDVMRHLKEMFPEQVEWRHIDIDRDDAQRELLQLVKQLGGMDIYFHVAGIGYENASLDARRELDTINTNVIGFTRMIDVAYHYFRRVGHGHIAAITSVAATKGIGEMASYSASKRYQQTYLQALEQLARRDKADIRFTDIRPGWVRTPLLDDDQEYPMTMTLQKAVPLVIRAIKRRSRIAVIDWRWATAVFFWRLIPGALWIRIPVTLSRKATPEQTAENAVEKL